MTITDLQQWVTDDWRQRSRHQPTVELQLLYIMEELGEVAEAIRKQDGKKDRKQSEVDLGSEMADLIISITTLANHFEVDMEQEIKRFQERITARHNNGY
jgi:NTP pyrophosphatase (non-canonical NTP hydrolase)